MKTLTKIILKLSIICLILVIVIGLIAFFTGYSYYSKALDEKPLFDRVSEYTDADNFVEYDELSKDYINAVISIEDHRYFEHGPIDPIRIN